jgi:hypothetical protein
MSFSRTRTLFVVVTGDLLTFYMTGIGVNFAAFSFPEPNIEDTLLFASIEGMEKNDVPVLAVLVTWFGVHAPWVKADRLAKLIIAQKSPRIRALWAALARGQRKDRRFAPDSHSVGTAGGAARKAPSARLQVMNWQYPFCFGASSNGTESPALTPKEERDERQ